MVPTFGNESFVDCENPRGESVQMKSALEAMAAIRVRSLTLVNVMNHWTDGRREVANRNTGCPGAPKCFKGSRLSSGPRLSEIFLPEAPRDDPAPDHDARERAAADNSHPQCRRFIKHHHLCHNIEERQNHAGQNYL